MINPYKLVKFQLSTGITCDPAASSSTLGCSSATLETLVSKGLKILVFWWVFF